MTGKKRVKAEFELPAKMVSLLYFHALAFAATPFCASSAIWLMLMIFANFVFAR